MSDALPGATGLWLVELYKSGMEGKEEWKVMVGVNC